MKHLHVKVKRCIKAIKEHNHCYMAARLQMDLHLGSTFTCLFQGCRSPSLLGPLRDESNVAEQVLPPRDLCKGACL